MRSGASGIAVLPNNLKSSFLRALPFLALAASAHAYTNVNNGNPTYAVPNGCPGVLVIE